MLRRGIEHDGCKTVRGICLTYINAASVEIAVTQILQSEALSGARNCRAMSFDLLCMRLASCDGTGKVT
jgi:hypothetical protein